MLPFTSVATVENKFATRVEINPLIFFTWVGVLEVRPSGDEWFEVNKLPQIVINLEGTLTKYYKLVVKMR